MKIKNKFIDFEASPEIVVRLVIAVVLVCIIVSKC